MEDKKSDVLIIGSGIIGLSCAYELTKKGAKVTLIDKGGTGLGCSYGNAGWITPCFAMPLPMPGMLLKSIKWLLDPLSPLYIKPDPSITLMRWLVRFLMSMNMKTAQRSIAVLTDLSHYSLKEYAKLTQELGLSFGFDQKGLLMVGLTPEGVQSAVQEMNLVAEHGVKGRFVSDAEIKILEPALTGPLKGGVYFSDEAHLEPFEATQALAHYLTAKGVQILPHTEVYDFELSERKMTAVKTTRGTYRADQFVLATGSWSPEMAKKLRLSVPVLGGKGYSIIVPSFNPSPKIPIMVIDRKIAVTPRKGSVRIAGTLELVNQDYTINTRRVEAIIRGSQQCMNVPEKPEILELWRGLRPCTPDGVPMIGYTREYSNLLLATGHQMLGMQSALGTGRLASDLLTGAQPIFNATPFRADRF